MPWTTLSRMIPRRFGRTPIAAVALIPATLMVALAGFAGEHAGTSADSKGGEDAVEDAAARDPELGGWRAPEDARQVENPVELDDEVLAGAERLFRRTCRKCHGAEGRGDGRMARLLDAQPADLTERIPLQSDGELYWKISQGRDPMPAFEEDLSAEDRWGLVYYLRVLAVEAREGEEGGEGEEVEESPEDGVTVEDEG